MMVVKTTVLVQERNGSLGTKCSWTRQTRRPCSVRTPLRRTSMRIVSQRLSTGLSASLRTVCVRTRAVFGVPNCGPNTRCSSLAQRGLTRWMSSTRACARQARVWGRLIWKDRVIL
uniref:Uncharacterized protein n=1 Tax=Cacopsylla melanoneura TaxID=428564 RepID=A0A8D9FJ53_9HEMI